MIEEAPADPNNEELPPYLREEPPEGKFRLVMLSYYVIKIISLCAHVHAYFFLNQQTRF